MDDENKPQISYVRKERYDPTRKEYFEDEIPTVIIKKFKKLNTSSANTTFSTYTHGAGTGALRVCYASFASGSAQVMYYVHDSRIGTLDIRYFEAAGAETIQGNPDAPVYVSRGTFKTGFCGSYAGGTYICSWWGVVR